MISYYARDPKNEQFLEHTSGFKGVDTNNHPLIYLKMPFSGYFIYVRVTFKVWIGSNRVQTIPSIRKTHVKSSKNCRKLRLIGINTPMGFSRSLGYNRVSIILDSRKHVKYL